MVAGCSGPGVDRLSIPDPPATTLPAPSSAPTLPAGLASLSEAPVAGVTTTTAPALGPGDAALTGTVLGPVGPVAGATVEADRFVGDAYASARTTTAADGSWSFRGVLGGRYRLRAWRPPDMAMASPQVLYLASGQPQSVSLQLTLYQGPQVAAAVNPAQPVEGQPADLVVQVTNPMVGPDGVVSEQPAPATLVTLVDGPGWQGSNGNPLVTGADGRALFDVQCTVPGADPLSAQVGSGAPVGLQLPPCAPAPATAGPPAGSPTPSTGSTATTCPSVPPTGPTGPTPSTTVLAFGNGC